MNWSKYSGDFMTLWPLLNFESLDRCKVRVILWLILQKKNSTAKVLELLLFEIWLWHEKVLRGIERAFKAKINKAEEQAHII